MASDENTAVNELIARVAGEASMRVAAPYEARHPGMPPSHPIAASPAAADGDPAAAQSWSASTTAVESLEPTLLVNPRHRERFIGTLKVRHPELVILIAKLALTMVLLMGAGILIGSYVVFSGEGGKPDHQAVAAPALKPAVIAPVTAPAALPALADVRIDSTPSGATVTLVDRGKGQFVGTTPVNATLETSREYDLVFTLPGKAAQQTHLDPRTTRHVAVTLVQQAAVDPAPAASAAQPAERPSADKAPALPLKKPVAEPAPSARKPVKVAEPVAGEGTLMVSSKPPCQIVIDGKPTGLTTPQRSIVLSAGKHKLTLINSERAIQKTVSVQITANATEKVIEDLMQ